MSGDATAREPRRLLTPEQLSRFQTLGHVPLGRVLGDGALESLRAEELRLRGAAYPNLASETPRSRSTFVQMICDRSEQTRRFCQEGPHLDAVEEVLGPNLCQLFDQYVTKLPDPGTGVTAFPWHQDNFFAYVLPPRAVSVWVALDATDERNGCLWFLPGSHLRGLLPHRKPTPGVPAQVELAADGIPMPLEAGEAVLFSGFALHRSTPNHTDTPRRAFFVEYCEAGALRSDNRQPVARDAHTRIVRGRALS